MSRDDLHFRLRIPPDLKDRVQAAAEENKRSMTAEIVATLEEKYPAVTVVDLGEYIESMLALIAEIRRQGAGRSADYVDAAQDLFLAAKDDLAKGRVENKGAYFDELLAKATALYPKGGK